MSGANCPGMTDQSRRIFTGSARAPDTARPAMTIEAMAAIFPARIETLPPRFFAFCPAMLSRCPVEGNLLFITGNLLLGMKAKRTEYAVAEAKNDLPPPP